MKIGISKLHVSLCCWPFYGVGSVVNSLIIVALIVCVDSLFLCWSFVIQCIASLGYCDLDF